MPVKRLSAAVFDLGAVLIDWNPRYLYRQLFDDEAEMETFLTEVCSQEWNAQQDAGRAWSDAVESLAREHPELRELIAAYHTRWTEMLGDPIWGTVEVLRELQGQGVKLYALSNWSAETYPIARSRFDFLDWFDGVVISGEVGICKPDVRIYRHLLERHGLEPESTVFIDDSRANVEAAAGLGFVAIRFESPDQLRRELRSVGLLEPAA